MLDMTKLEVGDIVETTQGFTMWVGPHVDAGVRFIVVEVQELAPYKDQSVVRLHVGMRKDMHPDSTIYVFGKESGEQLEAVPPCVCGEAMFGPLRAPSFLLARGVFETERCRACVEKEIKENPLAWRLYQAALEA